MRAKKNIWIVYQLGGQRFNGRKLSNLLLLAGQPTSPRPDDACRTFHHRKPIRSVERLGLGSWPGPTKERPAAEKNRPEKEPAPGTSNANARRESLNQPSDGICSLGSGEEKRPVERGEGVLLLSRLKSHDRVNFLDASTHLYMRVCPSVRGSVGRSVGRSITRFFLIAEIDKKQHRIIGKVETLFLDCNNLQKTKTKF